jgi:cytoskeletal protein RodZ
MASIENLGEYLKQLREEKKISVSQVAQTLKTKLETIHALEANDFEKIPAPTYVKGYLRSYANLLGIDADSLLMEYNRQFPQAKQPLVPPVHKIPNVNIDMMKVFKSKIFIFSTISIIILISLIIAIVKISHRKTKIHPAKKEIPEQTQQVQAKQEIIQKETQKTEEHTGATPKPNTPFSLPLSLSANAIDNVWIRVNADGKTIFEGVLQKSDKENWQAQSEFKLRVGNPSKLNLSVNNKPLGNISPYGPINVIINKDGFKIEK